MRAQRLGPESELAGRAEFAKEKEYTRREAIAQTPTLPDCVKAQAEGQQGGQSEPILSNHESELLRLMRSMGDAARADLMAVARGLARRSEVEAS